MNTVDIALSRYQPTNEISFRPIDNIFARLSPNDIEAIVKKVDEHPDLTLPPRSQYRFWIVEVLRLGAHLLPEIAKKTGLVSLSPPENVHSMHRMPIDVGSLYCPNLIDEVVSSVGRSIEGRCLDFGCSSGRVVRVMRIAYPDVEWHGCDPEADAIAWASKHFADVQFSVSRFDPPTDYPNCFFDLTYAISIWSHFDEETSKRWFDEMHRIIRPGGLLYWTTHSRQSLAHWACTGVRPYEQLANLCHKLLLDGFVFERAYDRDWSADVSRWGLTYITPDWVLTHLLGKWQIVQYRPEYESWNQDVYLLERV